MDSEQCINSVSSSDSEPHRKKRCLRFENEEKPEHSSILENSNFDQFQIKKFPPLHYKLFQDGGGSHHRHRPHQKDEEEEGDDNHPHLPEALPTNFFSDDTTELFGDTDQTVVCDSSVRTSIDTLSMHTDLSDLPDIEDPTLLEDSQLANATNSTSSSNTSSSSSEEPGESLSSLSSHSNSSTAVDYNNYQSEKSWGETWGEIFTNKEIQGNPSRMALMQRLLSHLRSNPDDSQLQRFMTYLLSCPEFAPPRHRLRHVTTIHDVTRLLRCSKNIVVLTGAGISVSCGIPDFRSKDGLYSRVSKVFPQLRDPQSVFDIRLFRRDPRPFFLTAKELYPGQFEPSLSHKFIRKLEMRGQLLRNYSQNIDTLETISGIERVTMCHGSFATATCIRCKYTVKSDEIKDKVLSGDIPYCPHCSTPEETNALQYPIIPPSSSSSSSAALPPDNDSTSQLSQDEESTRRLSFDDDDDYFPSEDPLPCPPVLKPDIVFFGEDLPDEFHSNLNDDKPSCDLLLVIGSSLRVRPVSLIPGMLPQGVPQILINRESLPHCTFDIELLGNCDTIISQLCHALGNDFNDLASSKELKELDKLPRDNYQHLANLNSSKEPKSEHDIQALKTCWEPKITENITDRLPDNSYLNWRTRQYVFEGAEVDYDPDDDLEEEDEDDDSSSSSGSESETSTSSSDNNRESGTDIDSTLELKLLKHLTDNESTVSLVRGEGGDKVVTFEKAATGSTIVLETNNSSKPTDKDD